MMAGQSADFRFGEIMAKLEHIEQAATKREVQQDRIESMLQPIQQDVRDLKSDMTSVKPIAEKLTRWQAILFGFGLAIATLATFLGVTLATAKQWLIRRSGNRPHPATIRHTARHLAGFFIAHEGTMNEHIRKVQASLGLTQDGLRGPRTDIAILTAADQGWVTIIKPVIIKTPDTMDPSPARDKDLIAVHPALIGVVEAAAKRSIVAFDVIEGLRAPARQAELVARGASRTMNSLHLRQRSGYAHAVDLWPIDPDTGKRLPAGTPAAEARLWADLRVIAAVMKTVARERGVNLEWGGDWGWDAPHFQLNRAAYA